MISSTVPFGENAPAMLAAPMIAIPTTRLARKPKRETPQPMARPPTAPSTA
jgi:hypothetical protein